MRETQEKQRREKKELQQNIQIQSMNCLKLICDKLRMNDEDSKIMVDMIIMEIKNRLDELEANGIFTDVDLEPVRDAAYGKTQELMKIEYIRLKVVYKDDEKKLFSKLITECKRMMKRLE